MLCILYVIALTTCLALWALLIERALPPKWPRRWIWCASIVLSIVIPPFYRSQHSVMLGDATTQGADASWWSVIGSYDAIILRVWAVTSAVLFVWALASVIVVAMKVRRSRVGGRAPTIVDGVHVALTETLGPAAVGVWRSRVVVPRWVLALPSAQRQYVLRHEDEHRKAHDTRLLFLMSLVIVVTPWNLPLYWQLRRLRLAVELDCDKRVVAALGDASAYGALLLAVAQAANRSPRLQTSFAGGAGMLERRLIELVAPARLSRLQRFALPLLAVALLSAVLSTPHPLTSADLQAPAATHQASHR